ncbi:MAG: hypothetical protein ABSC53_10715 [Bacteroidota bacterium]
MFNNKLISMNYRRGNTLRVLQLWGSACFQQLAGYQCRSPAVRDPRFDRRSNRDLLVRRLFGGAPIR